MTAKIFGSNDGVSDWMLTPFTDNNADRISQLEGGISKDDIVDARAEIERCAASGEKFYYGADTPDSVRKDLAEYAEAVGLPSDNMEQVSNDKIRTSKLVAEADAEVPSEPKPQEPLFDIIQTPVTDESAFAKDDKWNSEDASRAKSMDYRPDDNGVIPIRGGEEYEQNPVKGVRDGENSIANPDAIESVASAEDKDSAQLIRESNERKRSESVFDKDAWESEKAASMDGNSIIPTSGVHLVESPQSQNHTPGKDWEGSIVSDADADPMPEKTAGEQISELNDRKRAEISREEQDDDWEKVESSVRSLGSDLFYENLEKNLKGE